jgi:GT2 family glycosyltransferase
VDEAVNVSIVIPTLDPESPLIKQCLRHIGDGPEVIVQHDVDRDGFAVTCNRGAAKATGDLLVFLNDDTVPQPGWLEPLISATRDDRLVGSLLVYPDGTVAHSGVFLRRRGPLIEAYNRRTPAPSAEVPAVTGACLAVTRKAWDALDGFDEGYRNGYEDVDLCLRHRKAGGHVWYSAESVVVHVESQSPGRFDHVDHNVRLLNERWGDLGCL